MLKQNLFRGKNVVLRAPEPSDLEFICALENDTNSWNAGNVQVPYSHFQVEQYLLSLQHDIHSERQVRLMIDKIDGNCIGTIDLFEYEPMHRRAAVGIILTEDARGKGYAKESLKLVIHYGFQILNLHQLYCSIASDNKKSLLLFERCGFVPIGVRKEWRMEHGRWKDEITLQLLNPEDD